MKHRYPLMLACLASVMGASVWAAADPPLSGDYVEIRSCDVYTGPCFANGQMGLDGQEAILVWSVRQGSFDGVQLDGQSIVAVIKAEGTLGDVHRDPRPAKAVVIVDAKADSRQQQALLRLAQRLSHRLLDDIVRMETAPIEVNMNPSACKDNGCSLVEARGLVTIQTRCLGGADHVCGNEERFYPPLTTIDDARPAFTEIGLFQGKGLGITFDDAGRRSAYLGTFTAGDFQKVAAQHR